MRRASWCSPTTFQGIRQNRSLALLAASTQVSLPEMASSAPATDRFRVRPDVRRNTGSSGVASLANRRRLRRTSPLQPDSHGQPTGGVAWGFMSRVPQSGRARPTEHAATRPRSRRIGPSMRSTRLWVVPCPPNSVGSMSSTLTLTPRYTLLSGMRPKREASRSFPSSFRWAGQFSPRAGHAEWLHGHFAHPSAHALGVRARVRSPAQLG